MTLRQIYVRLRALPDDAPIWIIQEAEAAKAEQRKQVDDIDAALAPFQRKG